MLMLTACSGGVTGGANAAPADTGGECEGTINVLMHAHEPMEAGFQAVAAAFEEEHPGAKVELTFIPNENFANVRNARITAGDVDITEGNSSGATRELPDYVSGADESDWVRGLKAGQWTELSGDWLNTWSPGVREALQWEGKDYSVPTGISYVTGVYYNKDLFDANGIELPTTFDEFVAAAEKLKNAGITPLIMGGAEKWPVGLLMEGVASTSLDDMEAFDEGLWTGSEKFTDPEAVRVLEKIQTLYSFAEPTFPGISAATVTGRFTAGEAAMLPDGSWGAAGIQEQNPDFEWGYFPLPGSDNAEDNQVLRGKLETNMAIPANAKDPGCAKDFLEFYSQPEQYQTFITDAGFLPAMPDIKSTDFLESIAPYFGDEGYAPSWGGVFHPNPAAGQNVRVGFAYDQIAPMGTESNMEKLAEESQKSWEAALPKN
ncbi:extracellular solute-binding protein [Microbacterium sp. KSW4-11]|uniref:Extracellular solute-binding protein n=1 Tax=Microbacterium gawkjiense TaxID=3067309 RepID=A0ABU3GEW5_9MICO|nr:extracellular solute-binding protein [Microbacterium sp. KSW4-11]MDT3318080.1 extracellular solute-binding protein [Microbacterium sp. KSW4-11]